MRGTQYGLIIETMKSKLVAPNLREINARESSIKFFFH